MFQVSYSSQAIAKQLPIAISQWNFPMQMPNAQQHRSTVQMNTTGSLLDPPLEKELNKARSQCALLRTRREVLRLWMLWQSSALSGFSKSVRSHLAPHLWECLRTAFDFFRSQLSGTRLESQASLHSEKIMFLLDISSNMNSTCVVRAHFFFHLLMSKKHVASGCALPA